MHRNGFGRAAATTNRRQKSTARAADDADEPVVSTTADERADEANERTLPVKILRDYWASDRAKHAWPDEASNRIATGRVVALPLDEAKRAIEAGSAERADPLPGE